MPVHGRARCAGGRSCGAACAAARPDGRAPDQPPSGRLADARGSHTLGNAAVGPRVARVGPPPSEITSPDQPGPPDGGEGGRVRLATSIQSVSQRFPGHPQTRFIEILDIDDSFGIRIRIRTRARAQHPVRAAQRRAARDKTCICCCCCCRSAPTSKIAKTRGRISPRVHPDSHIMRHRPSANCHSQRKAPGDLSLACECGCGYSIHRGVFQLAATCNFLASW